MLFGNTSIHDDVVLHDAEIPDEVAADFGGPRHGLDGMRRRVGASTRALTCSALKPQGLPPAKLAEIARRFADGGIDYIKDDHGLADQSYSPFNDRVAAVAAALRGTRAHYVPSITGDLDAMRAQISVARDAGIDTVMVAPMIAGVSNFHRLVADNPDLAFLTHPALAGAARIAPPFHFGGLFRMLGRRRRGVSQSRRAVRLFGGDLPGDCAAVARAARGLASLRAGSGRRHEPRTRRRDA